MIQQITISNRLEKSIVVIEEVQQDVAELRNAENAFSVTNYIHLIDSLIETTNRSIMFSEEQEMEGSTNEFNEANRISMYISEMTLTILDRELKTSNRFYRGYYQAIGGTEKARNLVIAFNYCRVTFGYLLVFT